VSSFSFAESGFLQGDFAADPLVAFVQAPPEELLDWVELYLADGSRGERVSLPVLVPARLVFQAPPDEEEFEFWLLEREP
jgi:hypothetical protein